MIADQFQGERATTGTGFFKPFSTDPAERARQKAQVREVINIDVTVDNSGAVTAEDVIKVSDSLRKRNYSVVG